ncbi:MAG TPA: hypothetical protein VIV15_07270, partial [Anaerolineales bacterium]
MTQATQFLMVNGSQAMHVLAADVDTYLAAGWTIVNIHYSEGGEGEDTTSLILMVNGTDAIYVRAASVQSYQAQGYLARKIIYGASQIIFEGAGRDLLYLDVPAFSSAEVGTVDATTLAVTFSTEVASDDFTAGVTIEVDDTPIEITSATRQADHKVVYYVIPAVAFGEVVTWSYDDLTGEIASEVDGSPLDDVTDGEVT